MATAARLERYHPAALTAFRISEDGRTGRLALPPTAVDVAAALAAALPACLFKEKLAIRETDEETGEVKIHLYAVRRKAPQWVHPAGEVLPRRVHDHYADPICVIPGEVLG